MAVPSITLLPDPPLPTDPEAVFDAKAGASLTAQQAMVPQINTSLTWIGAQVTAIGGYANSSATNAQTASSAAASAAAIAAALNNQAGLPSMVGNARRALAVLANEQGVSYQAQIKLIAIDPMLKSTAATGALALNVGTTGVFDLTLTGAATLSFSNLPTLSATESMIILIRVTQGATAFALTWPSGITWIASGGAAPATPNAGKRTEYILTLEGGSLYGRKGAST
jgi:hypothetical protein